MNAVSQALSIGPEEGDAELVPEVGISSLTTRSRWAAPEAAAPDRLTRTPLLQQTVVQYALAVGITALIAFIKLLLVHFGILREAPYVVFALAVVISAWVGGFGPGMLSTLLCMIAVTGLRTGSEGEAPLTFAGMFSFLIQGIIISYLGHTRTRALASLARSAQLLERRVEERTRALHEANDKLEAEAEERERGSLELRALAAKLEISNRELQDFASVASHDLQEPLRKIQAFGDRLAARYSGVLGTEGQDYLRRMQNASERMQVLITDLLTLSRVTTKAKPFVPVNLRQIALDVVSDLEASIAQAQATVNIGELPEIWADPTQMRQLLQNLIGNAVKFRRPEVPAVVNLAAELEPASDETPAMAVLRVQDNGIGFEEKYLDRIFTVFQRLHGRGAYEGTGIGLAVCRRIVERHGGSITATSTPGEGSTFIVRLPMHQEEANE